MILDASVRLGSALAVAACLLVPAIAGAEPLTLSEGRIDYSVHHPFKQFDGWLEAPAMTASFDFDEANPVASKFSLVLDAAGFTTGNELRDSHQAEQIGLLEFPQVRFLVGTLTETGRREDENGLHLSLTARGKLQWHGVLEEVTWPVEVTVTPTEVVADASFELVITDYAMVPASLVGAAVAPEVPVVVHLVFQR